MPSGYTQPLYDGTPITFEQFALRCSRAMGAAIMQRDEHPDVEIRMREVEDHYDQNVAKAEAALSEALDRTTEQWAVQQVNEIRDATRYRDEYVEKRDAMRARYLDMISKVRAWHIPTEEHGGLKIFMLDQLRQSIDFDCGDYTPSVREPLPVSEYRAEQIGRLTRAHADAVERLHKEQERVASQNAWVQALKDSLS